MSEFINVNNSRSDEQRKVMDEIATHRECPFCPENLSKYHKKPILRVGDHWSLTENQWPYDHTKLHLLAISSKHVNTLAELDKESFSELLDHFQWAEFSFKIASAGLAMRFGNIMHNGSSVSHLHAHLIVPEANLNKENRVNFKIS